MRDYYLILGVSKMASSDEIKSAYRKLTLKYHPDKNPNNPKAKEQFLLINEAYDMLSDVQLKARYDASLSAPKSNHRTSKPKQNTTNYSSTNVLTPQIDFFIGDKKELYLEEEITFSWRCEHADSAYLYPIGIVPIRGSKTIRFTKWDAPKTKIELTAYNTQSLTKTTQTIFIENIEQMPIERQKAIKFKRRKKWLYEQRYGIGGILFFFFLFFICVKAGFSNRMIELEIYCGDFTYRKRCNKYNERLRAQIYSKVDEICEKDMTPELKDQLIRNYLKYAPEDD